MYHFSSVPDLERSRLLLRGYANGASEELTEARGVHPARGRLFQFPQMCNSKEACIFPSVWCVIESNVYNFAKVSCLYIYKWEDGERRVEGRGEGEEADHSPDQLDLNGRVGVCAGNLVQVV